MKITEKFQPFSCELSELKTLLARKLPLVKKLNNEPFTTLLLIMMAYAPIVSEEELASFFQSQGHEFRRALAQCQKTGKVVGVTLYPQAKKKYISLQGKVDGRTITAYQLTKNGFKSVCDYLGYSSQAYTPDTSTTYNMHTYSNGYNFFAFLTNPLLGSLDSYESEVNATFGAKYLKNDRGLCIDDIAKVSGATLYLEQDMGTESTSQLRRKMQKYGLHSDYLITSSTESVILSFRKGYQCITPIHRTKGNERYSPAAMRYTLEAFEHPTNISGMNTILDGKDVTKLETLIEALDKDLIITNHAQAIYDLHSDIKKHDLMGDIGTYAKLKEHYTQYDSFISPYYFNEFNDIQYRFMLNRRNALIKDMISSSDYFRLIGKDYGRDNHDITAYVLGCMHVYTVPTHMLSYYLPFLMYSKSFVKDIIENTLESYPAFKGFDRTSYKPKYYIKNDSPYLIKDSRIKYGYTLSNFYESDHFIFFVENLSLDLGAVARVSIAKQSFLQKRLGTNKHVVIIALIDSIEDSEYFRDLLGLSEIDGGNCPFQVFFLECKNPYRYLNGEWTHIHSYTELSDKVLFRYPINTPAAKWYVPTN